MLLEQLKDSGPIKLPPLPWKQSALAPVISAKTIGFHYLKHQAGYVKKLNELLADEPGLANCPLVDIIQSSVKSKRQDVFNNAAQVWNHSFYWNSLSPKKTKMGPRISALINSPEALRDEFLEACTSLFGSGWVWLALNKSGNRIEVLKTVDAETPITTPSLVPLLTMDVWEHAYYLDYQNLRADYCKAVYNKLFNWDLVEANLVNI